MQYTTITNMWIKKSLNYFTAFAATSIFFSSARSSSSQCEKIYRWSYQIEKFPSISLTFLPCELKKEHQYWSPLEKPSLSLVWKKISGVQSKQNIEEEILVALHSRMKTSSNTPIGLINMTNLSLKGFWLIGENFFIIRY